MAERQDYVPEALRAAEAEIARREIPMAVLDQALAVGKQAEAEALERKDIPLPRHWKFLYFFFSFLIISPVVVFFFRHHADRNYDRRSMESIEMTFLGFLFYMAAYGVLMRIFGPVQYWF